MGRRRRRRNCRDKSVFPGLTLTSRLSNCVQHNDLAHLSKILVEERRVLDKEDSKSQQKFTVLLWKTLLDILGQGDTKRFPPSALLDVLETHGLSVPQMFWRWDNSSRLCDELSNVHNQRYRISCFGQIVRRCLAHGTVCRHLILGTLASVRLAVRVNGYLQDRLVTHVSEQVEQLWCELEGLSVHHALVTGREAECATEVRLGYVMRGTDLFTHKYFRTVQKTLYAKVAELRTQYREEIFACGLPLFWIKPLWELIADFVTHNLTESLFACV